MSLLRKRLIAWLAASFMLAAAAGVSADQNQKAGSGGVPLPQVKIEKGDQCVEDTEVMRKRHMEFILHQRDETMHQGIRTSKHSLKNCINCHANPETNSVLGDEGFCQACHSYAAVSMDCFSCHTDKPEKITGQAPVTDSALSLERMVQTTPSPTTTNTSQEEGPQ